MNFSEGFKQTNQQCKFSPDGNFLVSKTQISDLLAIGRKLSVHRRQKMSSYVRPIFVRRPGRNLIREALVRR